MDQPDTVRMISDLPVAAGYEVFVAMTGEKGSKRAAVIEVESTGVGLAIVKKIVEF